MVYVVVVCVSNYTYTHSHNIKSIKGIVRFEDFTAAERAVCVKGMELMLEMFINTFAKHCCILMLLKRGNEKYLL